MQNLLKPRLLNYSVESTVYTLKFPKIPIKILSCPNTLIPKTHCCRSGAWCTPIKMGGFSQEEKNRKVGESLFLTVEQL